MQYANFFTYYPYGTFLQHILHNLDIDNIFSRAEDGDFIFNILSLTNIEKCIVSDHIPEYLLTVEIKKTLLTNASWHTLEDIFCGPKAISKLHSLEKWHPESFIHIRNKENNQYYLSNIETFNQLKTQLHKIKTFNENFFETLKKEPPDSFDLIFISNLIDYPSEYTLYNWPEIIKSRLKKNGRLLLRSSQPYTYTLKRLNQCGWYLAPENDLGQHVGLAILQPKK